MIYPLTPRLAVDEAHFWAKVGGVAKHAGYTVIEKALWLYFAARKPGVPPKARATIYGALGYLLLPADLIPDLLPFAGFSDDLGLLASAVGVVALHIDAAVKTQANAKLRAWFGPAARGKPARP